MPHYHSCYFQAVSGAFSCFNLIPIGCNLHRRITITHMSHYRPMSNSSISIRNKQTKLCCLSGRHTESKWPPAWVTSLLVKLGWRAGFLRPRPRALWSDPRLGLRLLVPRADVVKQLTASDRRVVFQRRYQDHGCLPRRKAT